MTISAVSTAMQASLSLVFIEKFSLRIEVVYGQDADRATLKLAEAEREPVLDADAAGSHFSFSRTARYRPIALVLVAG